MSARGNFSSFKRANLSKVRLRGAPVVTSDGPGGTDPADNRNMQQFLTIPTLDGITNLSQAAGFTIGLGSGLGSGLGATGFGLDINPPIDPPYKIAKTIMITAITAHVVLCSLTMCGI